MSRVENLVAALRAELGERIDTLAVALGEATLVVRAANYLALVRHLRDAPALAFDQCIDLCGIDYSTYADARHAGRRYAVVLHLLSVRHNWRLRVRTFCDDDEMPMIASSIEVWPAAGWYEREAFDLFGIVFEGHPDLRRLLTDYGFIGHPFRKDFPISGHVEMRYDPQQRRVIYQPVAIEPREITPRIVREPGYGS